MGFDFEGRAGHGRGGTPHRERWTLVLVFAGCIVVAVLITLQPHQVQHNLDLIFCALLIPMVMLKAMIGTWMCWRRRRFVQASLSFILAILLALGWMAELAEIQTLIRL